MSTPTGFLVVRSEHFDRTHRNPLYNGVDRVPPYPSEDESEQKALEALDEYVFGNYKDTETNLIPSLDAAVRLQSALSSAAHRYDILFCCEDSKDAQSIDVNGANIEHLGFDVASIRGDYYSIVGDFSPSEWASRFRPCLNGFGLFKRKEDAEEYLQEYCNRKEPDSDSSFDIVYVARVTDRGDHGR